MLDGVELLDMEAEERAHAGLFLAFQYPVEIGVKLGIFKSSGRCSTRGSW